MRSLKQLISFIVIVLITISCTPIPSNDPLTLYAGLSKDSKPNTLSEKEIENGWQLLFDGTTSTGWHGYNLDHVPDCWKIEDGTFTIITEGGGESQDIITDKSYKNFAFTVEYKLTPAANSGIIFQILEDSLYHFPYETGPEFQIIDHNGWPDPLEDWQKCAANYAMYPSKITEFKPVGEWNRILLVVNENQVTQILNGEISVEYLKYSDDWNTRKGSGKWIDFPDWGKFDQGPISLQNHGTKVWFRNIKIKEL